jgi:hypothetical protein
VITARLSGEKAALLSSVKIPGTNSGRDRQEMYAGNDKQKTETNVNREACFG